MKGKDFLSICDLDADEIRSLIYDAVESKKSPWTDTFRNKVLVILFEKPSARTRVSFDIAMKQLGGEALYLSQAEVGMGTRESVPDIARVISRYADIIATRTFSHKTIEVMASYADIPVINALSDYEHPCQALADLMTIYEKKNTLKGLTLAYIGDGNNIANSLVLAASMLGMNFNIASPDGFRIQKNVISSAKAYAANSGAKILQTANIEEAVNGADIVYTDVWASMGQENEAEERKKLFAGYQVTSKLMSMASKDAVFMHDLPAHRGEEVTDEVMESPQSVIFDQAENRLHAQRELLVKLLSSSNN